MSNLQVGDLISLLGGGNAKQSEVLYGKTFSSEYGTEIKGTMPDNSNINLNRKITSQYGAVNIPRGYTPGGRITCQIEDLVPTYIIKGAMIGGVTGTYVEGDYMGRITPGINKLEIRPLPTEKPDDITTYGVHEYLVIGELKSGTIRYFESSVTTGKNKTITYDIMTGSVLNEENHGSWTVKSAKYDPQTRILKFLFSGVRTNNNYNYRPIELNFTFK